ncbi:hypothetical protein [Kitasatospora kifunensis]|uniref:Uncharacterized protein n=1 Tax=Kitasatospora kifunensis TaxID=58351 RepID=A0A7W7QZX2_KITKI|nr:hypothetical protein [Kitasatospora kifunensis]MBB4922211.1 hypothetical protein [Kitasatospora kifunensis]
MRKIPTVFVRDPDDRAHVLPEATPGCEWVLADEGQATRKYDGTCVMLDGDGNWWARREVKPGKQPPANYVAEQHDEVTGKTVGWEPIAQSAFAKFHAEAIADAEDADYPEGFNPGRWEAGTYELVGPKVNGNPERCEVHELIAHAKAKWMTVRDLSFDGIRKAVLFAAEADGCEGMVWHHPDGRMAKIKARDFQ